MDTVSTVAESLFSSIKQRPWQSALALAAGFAGTTLVLYRISNRLDFPSAGPLSQVKLLRSLIAGDTDRRLQNLQAGYGPVVQLDAVFFRALLVSDPAVISQVLRDAEGFVQPPVIVRMTEEMIGPMLIALNGPTWKRHRQLVVRGINQNVLRHTVKVSIGVGTSLVRQWRKKPDLETKGVNLIREIYKLMNDVIGMSLFSVDFGAVTRDDTLSLDSYLVLAKFAERRINTPRILWPLLVPRSGSVDKAMAYFADNMAKAIKTKLEDRSCDECESSQEHDVLDMLLKNASDLNGHELEAELLGLYMASIETTTNTIGIILYLLAKHASVAEEARNEIREVLGTSVEISKLKIEDISNLTFLDAVVKEGLRFSSPPMLLRKVHREGWTIYGKKVPKGANVFLALANLHMSPEFFPDPLNFNPSRWKTSSDWLKPNSFLPFSDGPRRCVGERLALVELKAILVLFLSTFSWEIAPGRCGPSIRYSFAAQLSEGLLCFKFLDSVAP